MAYILLGAKKRLERIKRTQCAKKGLFRAGKLIQLRYITFGCRLLLLYYALTESRLSPPLLLLFLFQTDRYAVCIWSDCIWKDTYNNGR